MKSKFDRVSNTQGDGETDCTQCNGRGHLWADTPSLIGAPKAVLCQCVQRRDRIANVNRIWEGLFHAPTIKKSPLKKLINSNVWVTASNPIFKIHLRHVALRQDTRWFCRFESDQELARAWLANVEVEGGTIFDPDVASAGTLRYLVLDDLVKPPDLLIIKLGVKAAANKRMPEVLMESLQMRDYLEKPTWILDQPYHPFGPGHLCYSQASRDLLEGWSRVLLGDQDTKVTTPTKDGFVNVSMDEDATVTNAPIATSDHSFTHPFAHLMNNGKK